MNWFNDLRELFQVAIWLLCGGSCGFGTPGGETWTEQVKLQTGETLAVEREFRYGSGGFSGGPLRYARLEFDYRGRHYRWEEENVWPMVLQVDEKGRVVVASEIVYESAWNARGKPCDKALLQIFEKGKWKKYPSWEIHVERASNLAGGMEKGLRGIPMSRAAGSLAKSFRETLINPVFLLTPTTSDCTPAISDPICSLSEQFVPFQAHVSRYVSSFSLSE